MPLARPLSFGFSDCEAAMAISLYQASVPALERALRAHAPRTDRSAGQEIARAAASAATGGTEPITV